MKLSELKNQLRKTDHLYFKLPNGDLVPPHFHVTEVGEIIKNFIDCGGSIRAEKKVNLQLWSANDYNHRLHPEKLISIIELSEKALGIGDLEIEVEYQGQSIEKYGLEYENDHFQLTTKYTDCLAKDNCGIPIEKPKVKMSELSNSNSCEPSSGCC